MNRGSPSWSARTGRSPERGRTGRRAADLPNSFASARRPRQWATMPRWTTRQLVTKSMANSGGDGETPGAAEAVNESDPERRGASKSKRDV
jgi:hypothetical protein